MRARQLPSGFQRRLGGTEGMPAQPHFPRQEGTKGNMIRAMSFAPRARTGTFFTPEKGAIRKSACHTQEGRDLEAATSMQATPGLHLEPRSEQQRATRYERAQSAGKSLPARGRT